MTDQSDPRSPAPFPAWQGWLAVAAGMIAAANLVLWGLVGKGGRMVFDPAKRLGYELGTGLGMGIGLTLVLWLLVLRKAPRKWLWISLVCITVWGTLVMRGAALH